MTKGYIHGAGYHRKSYYQGFLGDKKGNAEVFANLFALKAEKDYQAIAYVRSFFPSVVAEFERIMKGGGP